MSARTDLPNLADLPNLLLFVKRARPRLALAVVAVVARSEYVIFVAVLPRVETLPASLTEQAGEFYE